MSIDAFRKYADMLSDYEIPVCTISGGEPTLAPDMPEILEEAVRRFPVKVMLISNFYARPTLFKRVMEAALRNNVHIVCSFDGFGHVADSLRGASNVSTRVCENLKLVTDMKSELRSRSI
jgi:MoaA/NifB/PqqE/SkfB family radical SAM enzyme